VNFWRRPRAITPRAPVALKALPAVPIAAADEEPTIEIKPLPESIAMSLVPLPTILTADPIQALGTALLQYLVARDILSQSGVPAQLAKAKAIAGFTGALIEVNSGQAAGVADLQTAITNLVSTVKDPAAALVLNEVLATLGTQLTALESTVIGKIEGVTGNLILTQINAVAAYYVQQLSATTGA
jgi:hypothetical protein